MAFRTNGLNPSEFDSTTNAVLATVQSLGTTDQELADDQRFLVDLLQVIARYDEADIPMDATIHVMDMAYIGLVYHRHMPFIDEATNEKVRLSAANPVAYSATLSMLASALIEQQGISPHQVMDCATDASAEAVKHLRQPETLDRDGLRLHTDFIALCILGLMVHRLIPTTTNTPQ